MSELKLLLCIFRFIANRMHKVEAAAIKTEQASWVALEEAKSAHIAVQNETDTVIRKARNIRTAVSSLTA